LYSTNFKLKAEKEKYRLLSEKIIDQTAILGSFDFPSDMKLLDEDGQKSSVLKMLDGKAKLFFRFTDLNSNKCVKSTLPLLKKLSKQIGVNNIVLLTSSSQSYEAQIFCQKNDMHYPFFEIEKSQLHVQVEILDKPYFFIMNKDYKVQSLFIPDENFAVLTTLYFSKVLTLFSKSELIIHGIKFDLTDIDLGEIKMGKKYSIDFWFKNEMKDPLVVYDVKTSCGCTVAGWDKKPLEASAKSKIKVEYNAEQKGYFTKSIRVISNAGNKLVELTIKGVVK